MLSSTGLDQPSAQRLRILVLTKYDRLGASSRLRFMKLIESADRNHRGTFEFTLSPLLGDYYVELLYREGRRNPAYLAWRYLRRAATLLTSGSYDGLWIEKELFPGLPAVAERVLSALGVRLVVDLDDATYLYYERNRNPLIRHLLARKMDHVFRSATLVVAGNSVLAERAASGGAPRVVTIPTVVATTDYGTVAGGQRRERPVLGWIGTPSNAPYLRMFADAIRDVQRTHGARFVMVGGAENGFLPGIEHEIVPWSEASEAAHLGAWDVALAPLEDGLWERGKCGYKVLQCMAAGLPVIASPVGVIKNIIVDGHNGFLADDSASCKIRLAALLDDPGKRRMIGAAARATVEEHYSIDAWGARWQWELARSFRGTSAADVVTPAVVGELGRSMAAQARAGG